MTRPHTWRPISSFGAWTAVGSLADLRPSDVAAQVLADQLVIVRDLNVSPATLAEWASAIGPLVPVPFLRQLPEAPGISRLRRRSGDGQIDVGSRWHHDLWYRAEPPRYGLLYAESVPRRGGETLFASQTQAYRRSSGAVQSLLKQISGLFSSHHIVASEASYATHGASSSFTVPDDIPEPVERPLVVELGGIPTLSFDPSYALELIGVRPSETEHVWRLLVDLTTDDAVRVTWSWRPGDLAIWDNHRLLHRVVDNIEGDRSMLRTNV